MYDLTTSFREYIGHNIQQINKSRLHRLILDGNVLTLRLDVEADPVDWLRMLANYIEHINKHPLPAVYGEILYFAITIEFE